VYAVYLLHGAGVIHRDIKPDNFLMNENGQCVLADFGLAFYPKNTRGVPFECRTTRGYYGTPGYLSPEQERRQDYNFKIDIWQLGCVWVEM
ncbi:kinase-like domain-containing protein, partial [Fomitopsis serialis]|uniref:kinase-like domain-containing protein n=1 Tax=Fomitopsis serialis TaxID=139415 RepID=UPI002008001D